jgi:hypothetical protein
MFAADLTADLASSLPTNGSLACALSTIVSSTLSGSDGSQPSTRSICSLLLRNLRDDRRIGDGYQVSHKLLQDVAGGPSALI